MDAQEIAKPDVSGGWEDAGRPLKAHDEPQGWEAVRGGVLGAVRAAWVGVIREQ